MGLTLEKLHRLEDKGFNTLYDKHKAKWDETVENAKTYARTFIEKDEKLRPGDLAEILQSAIKVDPDFEEYVKGKSLTQKYWITYFADYILDQVYPQAIK